MKRIVLLVAVFLSLFLHQGFSGERNSLEGLVWEAAFRASVKKAEVIDPSFSVTPCSEEPFSPPEISPLYTKFIRCLVQFPSLKPGLSYILYCPNTGDPLRPEFFAIIEVDTNGELLLILNDYPNPLPIASCTVYTAAIQGFSSDWYLLSSEKESWYHTTYTYKPIVARSADGREFTICKKDAGGNFLEIFLTGFSPHEEVQVLCSSLKKKTLKKVCVNEQGSQTFALIMDSNGRSKEMVPLIVSGDKYSLRSEFYWDSQTLLVEPISQPCRLRSLSFSPRIVEVPKGK